MATSPDKPAKSGFTLIELCVTIALAAIVMTIAAPSFARLISENRTTVAANELMSAMAHARSLAVTSSDTAILCPVSHSGSCSDTASWVNGWMICRDLNRDDDCTSQDEISRIWQVAPTIMIAGSEFRIPLRFRSDGTSAGSNQTLKLCDSRAASGRTIVLSNVGRARVARKEFEHDQSCQSFLESRG